MTSVVWKIPITYPGPTLMPRGARILHVDQQDGKPMLWALVDPQAIEERRDLLVLCTGDSATKVALRNFVGTIVGVEGGIVLHVFDEEAPF